MQIFLPFFSQLPTDVVFTILGYELKNEAFGKSAENRETMLLILRNETTKKDVQCRATATLKGTLEDEHKIHARFESTNFWLTHNGERESARTSRCYNSFSILTRARKLARR